MVRSVFFYFPEAHYVPNRASHDGKTIEFYCNVYDETKYGNIYIQHVDTITMATRDFRNKRYQTYINIYGEQ